MDIDTCLILSRVTLISLLKFSAILVLGWEPNKKQVMATLFDRGSMIDE